MSTPTMTTPTTVYTNLESRRQSHSSSRSGSSTNLHTWKRDWHIDVQPKTTSPHDLYEPSHSSSRSSSPPPLVHRSSFSISSPISPTSPSHMDQPFDLCIDRWKKIQPDVSVITQEDFLQIVNTLLTKIETDPQTTQLIAVSNKLVHWTSDEPSLMYKQLDHHLETKNWTLAKDRLPWWLASMIVLSLIAVVFEYFEVLIDQHPVLVNFVTCLVNTVGNLSTQSSVWIRQSMSLKYPNTRDLIRKECWLCLITSTFLSVCMFFLVLIVNPNEFISALVLAISLWVSAFVAVLLGIGIIWAMEQIKCLNGAEGSLSLVNSNADLSSILILCGFVSLFAFYSLL